MPARPFRGYRLADRINGSGEQWAAFFEAEHRALTAYAVALIGSHEDARDLIQDVLVRLVQDRRPVACGRTFVLRCIRNGAIDLLRRRGRGRDASALTAGVSYIDVTAASVDGREMAERVRRALEALTTDQREVIALRIHAGQTLREVASILDMPIGTVASHYARGIDRLRSLLNCEVEHEAG